MDENIALSHCQNKTLQDYYREAEEPPVTFQIGLIASDGWLLASDSLETFDAGTLNLASDTDKLYEDDNLAVAFSGHQWSRTARDRLVDVIAKRPENPRTVLTEIGRSVWQEIPANIRPLAKRTLIVTFAILPNRFYLLEIGKETFEEKPSFVTAGDDKNPAHFFIQHYYVREAGKNNTVDQLQVLAAHTILAAGKHNHRIQGLDMIICRNGERERLKDGPLKVLRARSKAIDKGLFMRLGVARA